MEKMNFQGHCISFQGFKRKNKKFQGPQGQLFKIKAFQGFQGLLAAMLYGSKLTISTLTNTVTKVDKIIPHTKLLIRK